MSMSTAAVFAQYNSCVMSGCVSYNRRHCLIGRTSMRCWQPWGLVVTVLISALLHIWTGVTRVRRAIYDNNDNDTDNNNEIIIIIIVYLPWI